MNLEQAMAASNMNSATYSPLSGGVIIVDGCATRWNPHYDEDWFWVQQPHQIVRQCYRTIQQVKEIVPAEKDGWLPYNQE